MGDSEFVLLALCMRVCVFEVGIQSLVRFLKKALKFLCVCVVHNIFLVNILTFKIQISRSLT